MDRSTLFQLLEEKFSDRESAIAKYGTDTLRVRDSCGQEHLLELRRYRKPVYTDIPLSWDINLLGREPVDISTEVYFKYMPPDGSILLQRFGLNNDRSNRGLLDREQIRERMGLLPTAEFLNLIPRGQNRGVGRTTEMIIDVLVNLQTKDLILVDSVNGTESLRIVREIKRRARGCGILPYDEAVERAVKVLNRFPNLRGYDPSKYMVFEDHSKQDRPTTGLQLSRDRLEFERRQGLDISREDYHVEQRRQLLHASSNRSYATSFFENNENFLARYNREIGADTGNLKSTSKPSVCQGCKNYNGSSYGGNLLICGMYPYGCDTDVCPDWEGKTFIYIDLNSIRLNPSYRQDYERICTGKTVTIEWIGRLPDYLRDGNNISIRSQSLINNYLQTTFILSDPNLLDRLRTTGQMRSYDIENHWQRVEYALPQEQYSFQYQSIKIKCGCGKECDTSVATYCAGCLQELDVEWESIENAIVRKTSAT